MEPLFVWDGVFVWTYDHKIRNWQKLTQEMSNKMAFMRLNDEIRIMIFSSEENPKVFVNTALSLHTVFLQQKDYFIQWNDRRKTYLVSFYSIDAYQECIQKYESLKNELLQRNGKTYINNQINQSPVETNINSSPASICTTEIENNKLDNHISSAFGAPKVSYHSSPVNSALRRSISNLNESIGNKNEILYTETVINPRIDSLPPPDSNIPGENRKSITNLKLVLASRKNSPILRRRRSESSSISQRSEDELRLLEDKRHSLSNSPQQGFLSLDKESITPEIKLDDHFLPTLAPLAFKAEELDAILSKDTKRKQVIQESNKFYIFSNLRKLIYHILKVKTVKGTFKNKGVFRLFKKKNLTQNLKLENLFEVKKKNAQVVQPPFPPIFSYLTEYIVQQGGLETEGIMRISMDGNIKNKLLKEFLSTKKLKLSSYKDPHVPAAMLKCILDHLKPSLIPDYNYFLKCDLTSKDSLVSFCSTLPPLNLALLKHLACFVKKLCEEEVQKKTRMGFANLIMIFSPILVKPETKLDPIAELTNLNNVNNILGALLLYLSEN